MRALALGLALGGWTILAADPDPSPPTASRLEPSRLAAARAARAGFARQRAQLPDHGLWIDVRAAFVRLPEGPTGVAGVDRAVAAARRAGVRILIPFVPGDPPPGTWRGWREGVLILPGVETAEGLIWLPEYTAEGAPRAERGLRFLAVDAPAGSPTVPIDGIEIAGRGSAADPARAAAVLRAARHGGSPPALWQEFPDEVAGAAIEARPDLIGRWDRELERRALTAIAVAEVPAGEPGSGLPPEAWDGVMRSVSTHLLLTDLSEAAVRSALEAGRAYVAQDWLCDPAGFVFGAVNNLGVFPMGDSAPFGGTTRAMALGPVPARLKLVHNGRVIHTATGTNLTFEIGDFGAYRVEAWLAVAGEERPWIYSNPIRLRAPTLADMRLPSNELAGHAEVTRDLAYVEGKAEDEAKHRLDVYRPKGATNAPVFFFVHGGAWKYGDRNQYTPLGNRYTREGFVTVVPSYRLAPKNPFPAQIEDVAAAFAWTLRRIGEWGGDTNRLCVGGHSAGGHLAALLALDRSRLEPLGVSPASIRSVLALSGVYDLTDLDAVTKVFSNDPADRRAASPLTHVRPDAPPFLVTYCQWDYFSLPAQARRFHAALGKAGVPSALVYVPGQNHISEMLNVGAADDPTVAAAVGFMRGR